MSKNIAHLGKNTLIYGLGGLLNRFISLLLLPIFTAYLSTSDFGVIAILALFTFIATPVFSFGISASLAPCYYEKKQKSHKESTIWTAFVILFFSILLLTAVGFFFSDFFSQIAFKTTKYNYLVKVTFVSTSLIILNIPLTLYMQFEEKAKLFITLTVICTLFSASASFFMIVILKKGIQGFVEAQLIGQIVNLVVFIVPSVFVLKFRFNIKNGYEILRLGIPLIPSFAFLFIMQDGNKYLIMLFGDLDAVGIYTIGINFGLLMSLFVSAFSKAWLPFFMSYIDKKNEAEEEFGKIASYYIIGFGTLSLFFFILAKPIITIMTQPAFHEAYRVVGISACTQFLSGLFAVLLPGMYFTKEVRYVSLIQAISMLISVCLNVLLIPIFSYFGAAIGLMLGFLSMVILTYFWNIMRKQNYIQIKFEWDKIIKFLIIYICCGSLMLLDRNFMLLQEFVYSSFVLATLLFFVFHILHQDEREKIIDLISGIFHKTQKIKFI